jgi:hypothetical protein
LPPNQNSLHTFNPTLKKEKNYLPLPLKTFSSIPANGHLMKKGHGCLKKKKKKKRGMSAIKRKRKGIV